MKNILKKTVDKKSFEVLKNGGTIDIRFDVTPYQCKRLKGFGTVCPYSLPFNETDRFCQKHGCVCISGKEIKFTECIVKLTKSEETIDCDIIQIKGEYKDKPNFIINVKSKEQNTKENNLSKTD